MSISSNDSYPYDSTDEATPEEPTPESQTGDGGDVMGLWYEDRTTIVNRFLGASATNASSFATPPGIADDPNTPYDSGAEVNLGYFVTGRAIAPSGLLLEGTLQMERDGERVDTDTVAGSFVGTAPPPSEATDGADAEGGIGSYTAVYQPKVDGVASVKEDLTIPDGGELATNYGIVYGWVTDEQGEPVADATVSGAGAFTTTDLEGYYEILAPGDTQVPLRSIEGTASDEVYVTAGPDGTRRDWQFAGVEIRVLTPEYDPIENAPVEIDGDVYRTDENGRVKIGTYPLGEYDVEVMGSQELTVTLTAEGALEKETVRGGRQLKIDVYDESDGQKVANVPAVDTATGTFSYTTRRGVVSVLAFGTPEFDVYVGEGDPRYLAERVEASPGDGETETAEVRLEPRPATSNR